MAGAQEQQAVVRKLSRVWLEMASSASMIAAGLMFYIMADGVGFGDELPAPMPGSSAGAAILGVVLVRGHGGDKGSALHGGRLWSNLVVMAGNSRCI